MSKLFKDYDSDVFRQFTSYDYVTLDKKGHTYKFRHNFKYEDDDDLPIYPWIELDSVDEIGNTNIIFELDLHTMKDYFRIRKWHDDDCYYVKPTEYYTLNGNQLVRYHPSEEESDEEN